MSGDHNIYQKTTGIHEQQFFAKEAQPMQEPVACTHGWFKTGAMAPGEMRCIHCGEWRDTAPQPRQWQGLTEEEIGVAFRKAFPVGGVVFTTEAVNFYRAIEAKLREKNQKENPGVL